MSRIKRYDGSELLEKLGAYASPQEVADALKIKRGTIYAWKAEPQKHRTPANLFFQFQGRRPIYVVTEVLNQWLKTRDGGAR